MKKASLVVPLALAITAIAHSQTPPAGAAAMPALQIAARASLPAFRTAANQCAAVPEPTESGPDTCASGNTKNGTCGTLSGPRSNRCVNQALNAGVRDANGRAVSYQYFGADDCRVGAARELKSITKFVVHNGGYTAKQNSDLFKCDNPFPTHYTIERDGTIHQFVGEERHTAHANNESQGSIGVELNIGSVPKPNGKKGSTSCNSLGAAGEAPATDANIRAACTPTSAQYASLRALLAAIEARTGVLHDKDHVIGHCEARTATHGDPRGFDWRELGLSNAEKLAKIKATDREGTCSAYGLFP